MSVNKRICARCIYDESVPSISFDGNGVCNYCHMIDNLKVEYQTGLPEGEKNFQTIVEEIKKAGKGKKYDCVIGVSGGTDSSYMVYWAIQQGLRPLAVHYDNTWNTAIATENIRKVLTKLKVDLYTHVTNNKEMDDIYRSFFLVSRCRQIWPEIYTGRPFIYCRGNNSAGQELFRREIHIGDP